MSSDSRVDLLQYELPASEVAFTISDADMQRLDPGEPSFRIIGQGRALQAITMARGIRAKGYNLFVTGPSGTGKRTAVQRILENSPPGPGYDDIICVHNFAQEDSPIILRLPPGTAPLFRAGVAGLVELVGDHVQEAVETQSFRSVRDDILLSAEEQENSALKRFETRIEAEGFRLVELDDESRMPDLVPVVRGRPTNFEDLQRQVSEGRMPQADYQDLRQRYFRYIDEMQGMFERLHDSRAQAEAQLNEAKAQILEPVIQQQVEELRTRFPGPRVSEWLERIGQEMLGGLSDFLPEGGADGETPGRPDPLARYGINVLVTRDPDGSAPVVFENSADHHKLFGYIDAGPDPTAESRPDFRSLRPGSAMQASGGFLVLRAEDILTNEESWNTLRRLMRDGEVEIRNPSGPFPIYVPQLRPEPIPLNVKVVIMGTEPLYEILYNRDEEFQRLFKIPAEFDWMMDRHEESMREYLGFMRMIQSEEGLLELAPSGMAAVMEHAVRLSELRSKLSTRFSLLADLLREADYWASSDGGRPLDRTAVQRALAQRQYLSNLPEEKIDEQIRGGELILRVDGTDVGRINGLAVIDRGYYAFARPMVITARTAPGSEGIVNVERESGLSGEIHDKGVYILEGFLLSRYARNFPLAIRASIVFEQSYVEVDGDSASSTEIYVLLSAIAGLPLRQDLAVTGSVNQMGEIQPVGGVSEKVEGFFSVCRQLGLTGKQGVIIPRTNIESLVVSTEIQQAVADGQFHIYAVSHIDQGIEILTGKKVSAVDRLVKDRLLSMAEQAKEYGGS